MNTALMIAEGAAGSPDVADRADALAAGTRGMPVSIRFEPGRGRNPVPAEIAADRAAMVELQVDAIVCVVNALASRDPEAVARALAALVIDFDPDGPFGRSPARPSVLRAVASALNVGAALQECGS